MAGWEKTKTGMGYGAGIGGSLGAILDSVDDAG